MKKIYPKDNEGLLEALVRRHICKKNGKGQLILNPAHSYYYQVQQELFCSGRKVEQSNCQLWFDHQAPWITALKCKRALVEKGTSPIKALSEILQFKSQVSTDLMKDGLESEPAIIEKKTLRKQM